MPCVMACSWPRGGRGVGPAPCVRARNEAGLHLVPSVPKADLGREDPTRLERSRLFYAPAPRIARSSGAR
eukprot:11183537-Lingulodinium_polyedra.AAC.1